MRNTHTKIGPHLGHVAFLDDLPRLDVRRLEILDPLFAGQTPICTLYLHGRPYGAVAIDAGDAHLQVHHIRLGLNFPKSVDITVKLHYFAMPRGGSRPAFICPLCSRTAPLLFLAGPVFACRYCMGLPYRSQGVAPLDRVSGMAAKFRRRLSLGPRDEVRAAKRPKRMKQSTFERLKREIETRERRALLAAYREFFRRYP